MRQWLVTQRFDLKVQVQHKVEFAIFVARDQLGRRLKSNSAARPILLSAGLIDFLNRR